MTDADRWRRIGLWWQRIDRYVWSDVTEVPELSPERLAPLFDAEERDVFLSLLQREQANFRHSLETHGVERLATNIGDSFEPGILEPKPGAQQPTEFQNLDMTAGSVVPGDAGYKVGERVKRPSRAPRLRYVPEPCRSGRGSETDERH